MGVFVFEIIVTIFLLILTGDSPLKNLVASIVLCISFVIISYKYVFSTPEVDWEYRTLTDGEIHSSTKEKIQSEISKIDRIERRNKWTTPISYMVTIAGIVLALEFHIRVLSGFLLLVLIIGTPFALVVEYRRRSYRRKLIKALGN